MKHLSIETIKEEVTIDMVLNELGASTGWVNGWGEWLPVNCPFHHDQEASASMNRGAGLFLCHGCGAPNRDNGKAGDIIDVAKYHLQTQSISEAIEWLCREFK